MGWSGDARRWLLFPTLAICACSAGVNEDGRRSATDQGYLDGAPGVELYYRVLGLAPDSVVVVHGAPGAGMQAILPHIEPLANRHTLIFYDQRGPTVEAGFGVRLPAPEERCSRECDVYLLSAESGRQPGTRGPAHPPMPCLPVAVRR